MAKVWDLNTKESDRKLAYQILSLVGNRYKITTAMIFKRGRFQEVVKVRQLAIYLILKHTSLGYKGVADLFERDRATIYYSENRIQEAVNNSEKAYLRMKELDEAIAKLTGEVPPDPSAIDDFGFDGEEDGEAELG